MAADFPTNVVNLPNKSDGEKLYAAEYNKIVDEITAIETNLISTNGLANLVDPNADRILFWDDSVNKLAWLTLASGLEINGTTLSPKMIGAKVRLDANQSVPSGTWTSVLFGAEDWDTNNMHDIAANMERITIQVAGRYRIETNINFFQNSTGMRSVRIMKNGTASQMARQNVNPTTVAGFMATVSVATELDCAVGDYFLVMVFQNSGAAIDLDTAIPVDFSARLIG